MLCLILIILFFSRWHSWRGYGYPYYAPYGGGYAYGAYPYGAYSYYNPYARFYGRPYGYYRPYGCW